MQIWAKRDLMFGPYPLPYPHEVEGGKHDI